ncbi:MAG: 5'-nucleotidase C-terminal domain-containing protein [Lachnospiraceae bacterium]|nr:5'-nucleotidase C-terminal domain-containing protein [Lachnospiraceae bacterium]
MASIIARAVGAEVGFVNSGGIRTDLVITSGWRRLLTVSDIYTMFPFNNRLYCYELTYEDFLTLLRYALTESGGSLLSRMTGIECYYIGEEVQAIVRDGKAIYADNEWQGGWKDRKIRVGVSEFVATSNRVAGTMQNPLVAWSKTSRLISSDLIDAEGAFQVLDAESEANHWELSVDKTAYFVYGRYTGPVWSEEDEKAYEAAENETASGESEVTEPAVSTAPADESSPSREVKDRFAFLKNPLLPLIPVVLIVLVFGIIRWRQQTAEKDDNEPDGPESAE